jgi:hypothetical protein
VCTAEAHGISVRVGPRAKILGGGSGRADARPPGGKRHRAEPFERGASGCFVSQSPPRMVYCSYDRVFTNQRPCCRPEGVVERGTLATKATEHGAPAARPCAAERQQVHQPASAWQAWRVGLPRRRICHRYPQCTARIVPAMSPKTARAKPGTPQATYGSSMRWTGPFPTAF